MNVSNKREQKEFTHSAEHEKGAAKLKKYLIDVYIVDDHTMLTEGLADAINRSDKAHVSRTFNTLEACQQALQERRPDVLLLDISMPDGDAFKFCQWVANEYSKVRIIAVTIHDEYSVIRRMLDSGVHGYVLKCAAVDELIAAIVNVWQGKEYVSQQVSEILQQGARKQVVLSHVEQNILELICSGKANPEIAAQLHLSKETVNWYRKRLLAKYDVKNSVALVRLALEQRLI